VTCRFSRAQTRRRNAPHLPEPYLWWSEARSKNCERNCRDCRWHKVSDQGNRFAVISHKQAQVRITGTLEPAISHSGKVAGKSWRCVQQLANQILKVAAHFIDSRSLPDDAIRGIDSLHHFVQRAGDLFQHCPSFSFFELNLSTRLPVASKMTSLNGIAWRSSFSSSSHGIRPPAALLAVAGLGSTASACVKAFAGSSKTAMVPKMTKDLGGVGGPSAGLGITGGLRVRGQKKMLNPTAA
jgi:hypothetical protein